MKRPLGLVSLLLSCCLLAFGAHAASKSSQEEAAAQRKLDTLRSEIARLTEAQKGIDDQRSAATTELRTADSAVAEAVRALRRTETAIDSQQVQLAALQQHQSTLELGLSRQREVLSVLVRSAYALGRHEQLKLLLAQDRISDLARVLAYHRYFQNDRQQRIAGLIKELRALAEVEQQVQSQQQILDAARLQQQTDLSALEQQRSERGKIMQALERRFRDQGARLVALGRDEKSVLILLERLRNAVADIPPQVDDNRPFASRRGQLPRPLIGAVIAGFGGRLPDGRSADGLLIAGTAGAEVRAVAPGRVAYADWFKGYGLLLILDHGDGWMSLYAFNDALLKDVGDWLRAGEVLATVGSSGGQGRPALYFELRRNGQSQNPKGWLKN